MLKSVREKIIFHWQNLILIRNGNCAQRIEKFFLGFIALFYALAVHLRNRAYDRGIFEIKKAGTTVISVGNLTTGGTGKTTLVYWLAKELLSRGKKSVILSRGYMRNGRGKDTIIVSDETGLLEHPSVSGDEPALLAKKLKDVPVIVGSDRAQSAELAMEKFKPEVLLLDDGFQHRRLERNLNIVCADDSMFNAPRLFPRGVLREGASSLQRADFIAVKDGGDPVQFAREFEKCFSVSIQCPVGSFCYRASRVRDQKSEQIRSLEFLKGQPIISFSAIARPEYFERMLVQIGAVLRAFKRLPDHHSYTKMDLGNLLEASKKNNAILVTTEKDAVKLPADFPAHALEIELEWLYGKEELIKLIEDLL